MPENRPAIPLEIQRQILFESGHRCSVCPERLVLEIAHIVQFAKTKDNSPENLICLCPNCHAIADYRGWDERTFRLYKENPWFKRNGNSFDGDHAAHSLDSQDVVFVLKGQAASFDEIRKFMFQSSVARLLNMKPEDVIIKDVRDGSIQITARLPSSKAWELFDAWNLQGDLLAIEFEPEELHDLSMKESTIDSESMPNYRAHRVSPERRNVHVIPAGGLTPILASMPFWARIIYQLAYLHSSFTTVRKNNAVLGVLILFLSEILFLVIVPLMLCTYGCLWEFDRYIWGAYIVTSLAISLSPIVLVYKFVEYIRSFGKDKPLSWRLNEKTTQTDQINDLAETTTQHKR